MTAGSMAPSMSKRQSSGISIDIQGQSSTGFAQEQLKSQLSLQHSSFKGDDSLFHTPQDLLCPITLSLFQDPVINAVGQVYERAAIQRHLLQAALTGNPPTDPISNAVLPSLDLVPVYPMRSRAAHYRESTARECVRLAAAPNCTDPVRYLRRAAELVVTTDPSSNNSSSSSTLTPAGSGAPTAADSAAVRSPNSSSISSAPGFSIPGMTLDFARYLAAHQSSVYNTLVLKYFGNELLRAGCADSAADVFYRLLLEADERVQQAEYLQLCLDCWTSSNSSSGTESSEAPSGTEGLSAAADDSTAAAPDTQQHEGEEVQFNAGLSPVIIGKLADFVQRQRCLSPSAIVHMLQSTNHGTAMAVQLCQVLLARASATAAAAATPGSEAEAAVGLPGGLGGALEVLVSYVELHSSQLKDQLQELTNQVKAVHRQPAAAGSDTAVEDAAGDGSADAAAARGADNAAVEGKSVCKGEVRRHGAAWKGGKGLNVMLGRVARVAAAGSFAAASMLGGNHLLLRCARVAPLMYLLRAGL